MKILPRLNPIQKAQIAIVVCQFVWIIYGIVVLAQVAV